MQNIKRIETAPELEALAEKLQRQKVVAVDTEADSFYHYFDKTCLVQIATPRSIYLLDPLALKSAQGLKPLGPLFASPQTRKIFHAADYDLFVLKRDYGFDFANIFDTMVSAQLLGYTATGLASIVERHLGIAMHKDEQRSDWSARPLRENQLRYAAEDVAHLIKLAQELERELKQQRRLEWAREEFEQLANRERPGRGFDPLGYLRLKGAKALSPHGLAVLRALYLLRDKRAKAADRPPFKVIGNRALLEIAERQPLNKRELARIKGVSDLIVRRFGDKLLKAVEKGRAEPHGPIPKNAPPVRGRGRRLDRPTERRMERLRIWRSARAPEVGLQPGVLCPNATLECIARALPQNEKALAEIAPVRRWFARAFGAEVVEVLRH